MSRYNGNLVGPLIRPLAKLGKLTTNTIGKHFASDDGLDGYNVVDVRPMQLTATAKDFLCGNALKRTQVLDGTIAALQCVLAPCFPNLSTVLVGNTTQVVTGLDDALDGLTCDVIVPNTLLGDYQTAYAGDANLTFATWTLTVDFTIPHLPGMDELTAEYVRLVASTAAGDPATVGKVIIPVEFTSYESGAIAQIQASFSNMEHLVTCYEGGDIDLDLNGEIVAKVLSIGKTLDEALVYARSWTFATKTIENSIIIPPNTVIPNELNAFYGYTNLVYVPSVRPTGSENGRWSRCFQGCTNLIEANVVDGISSSAKTYLYITDGCTSLKRFSFTAYNGAKAYPELASLQVNLPSLTSLLMNGVSTTTTGLYGGFVLNSTTLSREAWVEFFNSLGTTTVQGQITIGATNLAKLTAEDIAIATAKNWNVVA